MVNEYREAFSRNLGWITEQEQQTLREKRIAVAGAGGVGGLHLLTLARLGIGAFNIADMDRFELANFNRQAGAFTDTIGKEKTDVMADIVRRINPEADLRVFSVGVTEKNLDDFLSGVDLFIDGFDAFAIDIRAKTFARCADFRIPAITAGPNGMGSGYLVFLPGKMTFEEYFRLEGLSREQRYASWFLSQVPALLHLSYLVEPSRMDLLNGKAPSLSPGCFIASGIAGVEAVKILLGRGKVYAMPYYHQFDAYRGKYVRRKLRGGNRNRLQRLKIWYVANALLRRGARDARPAESPSPDTPLMRILDAARWTPSGDNAQPWIFDILGERKVALHISPPSPSKDIMNIRNAEAALLSTGMMLEIMSIAAGREGKGITWTHQEAEGVEEGTTHRFEISFHDKGDRTTHQLYPYISLRHTDRRHYRAAPLTDEQKRALEEALGDGMSIHWRESREERREHARLNMRTFAVQRRSKTAYRGLIERLEWRYPFSRDKVPAATLPVTLLSRRIMQWGMRSWTRMAIVGSVPGALLPSAVVLELLPGIRCAAHFILTRKAPLPLDEEQRIAAVLAEGRALIRFWLTLEKLGLAMQPAYAPIVFAHYGTHPQDLPTGERHLTPRCRMIAERLFDLSGLPPEQIVFTGRIGSPKNTVVSSRSLRKPLKEIIV